MCSNVIIILLLDLWTLYCNIQSFWNVFVINRCSVNKQCLFSNHIHSTTSRWKCEDSFDFSRLFHFSRTRQSVFFSWINSCCFYVFDQMSQICWDGVFSTICQLFVSCSSLFKLLCFSKLKWMKESLSLKRSSLSSRETWTLLSSRL